jgi:alkylation response protein AidB-like acyl-CoA dehydrogenase
VSATTDAIPFDLVDLEPDERAVVEKAREISVDVLAKNAPRYDIEAVFPAENFDAMRAEGFTGVVVPKQYGGLGLGPQAYSLFLKSLAKGCASTAGSFHMHNSVMRFLDVLGTHEQKEHYYAEAVSGKLFGSWGAEPGTSWAGTIALNTGYDIVPEGFKVNGAKYFCSLGEGASYGLLYAVATEKRQQANLEDVQFFMANTDNPGVEIKDQWDPIGMRATVSKPVILTDCVVPQIAQIGEPGGIRRIPSEFYGLGYSSFYQGIAEAAYEWALNHAQTRTVQPSNEPIGKFDRIQRKIGAMAVSVHQGALAVEHAARRVAHEDVDRGGSLLAVMKAKAITTVTALEVTNLAIDVAGGPGVIRGNPPERLLRDARAATLMVPAFDQCMETVAKNELGYATRELH